MGGILALVDAEIARFQRDLAGGEAGVEVGALVSLTLAIPEALVSTAPPPGGDTWWLAADQGLSLCGGPGRAATWTATGAEGFAALARRFDDERARWRDLGSASALGPRAFFTYSLAQSAMWVPSVLLAGGPDGGALVLTARREAGSIAAVARTWREEVRHLLSPIAAAPVPALGLWRLKGEEEEARWVEKVEAARLEIAAGRFTKVVLARAVDLRLAAPPAVSPLLAGLARRYPESVVLAVAHAGGRVVAASPERVAVKRADILVSHALAGTAARQPHPRADADAARRLRGDDKQRREHAIVVAALVEDLAALCVEAPVPPPPAVLSLRLVHHLHTPVAGRLKPGVGLLEAVGRLHPSPAVAGFPRAAALSWLAECRERRDGLYTAVAGWIDGQGDGEAVVVLRSAHLVGNRVRLWAGAGIVAGSDPQAELAETELKLATMLEALGG